MNENKEKLQKIGEDILGISKNEIYVSMRFLDTALESLGSEMDLSMRTAGTDGETIRYNTSYLIELFRDSTLPVNRICLHMLLHCIFRHMYHADDKDKEFWDLSCDIAVGSVLDDMDYRCVRQVTPDQRMAVYDRMKKCMPVLTAEGIYKELTKNPPGYFELEEMKKFFTVDDHVFWDARKEDSEDDPEKEKRRQERERERRQEAEKHWDDVTHRIKTNLETYSRDATNLAAALYDYIKVETRTRADYGSFLRKFASLREEMRIDTDSFDYIYYNFGLLHYGNMPLIEPLEYKENLKIKDLAIVIDTSESCEGENVKRFLEETFSILLSDENFFDRMNVHIIQSDVSVQIDTAITSIREAREFMKKFKVQGFGGTDFRPAIEYVNRLCEEKVFTELKGLIYFTDGYGEFPKLPPPYEVAFAFLDGSYTDRNVPPWAIKLIIGPDELKENSFEYQKS
ncbi:MAG: VWA-like domain-containing protein [Lachnospiraceae bacterium]|nr:VWA-like domain-containing protein [Lachnospiraceae bacterium]